ncbi:lipopolysaccharide biosynthesis protein [Altererythrobacter sp. Root672]|uniref:lipopolysaccharide biosynthesis protein n=1 Tax=Altererythrobacter sp. Root672 TaxID=1736584 RepID=UPI000ADB6F63|nr:lipopolysaccharide biosynthesis protein [Altererythrobacter sp. Root672]
MIRRALQNTGWLMGARGVNGVLSLAYLALVTRALGLEGFGYFTLCLTFAQAVAGLTSFQTWQAVIRWGQQREAVKDAVGFALALDLLAVGVGAVASALLLAFAGDWLPIPQDLRPEAYALTLVFLLSIRSTPTGILRLHDRFAKGAGADTVTSIVRVIGAGIVAIAVPTIEAFLIVWALAEIATAATYWIFALQCQKVDLSRISLRRLPRAEPGAWAFVWGTALSGTLQIASRQILVLLVGALGGATLAGIYRVAAQLGEGLLKLAQALMRATYPELVRDPEAARHIASRIGKIALYTGLGTVLFSVLGGHWVIKVIAGPEFIAAYAPMIILSAAAAIELAGASLEALLVSRGHALRNFMLRGVPTGLALASLPFAMTWIGVSGAAAMVFVSSLVSVAALMWVTRERDVRPDLPPQQA